MPATKTTTALRDASLETYAQALKSTIVELMTGFSIELTPRELKTIGRVADHLRPRTRVYVTWLAGSDYRDMARASKTLREQGLEPVPHLAVRAVGDEIHLDTILRALREEADVKELLVIGGSVKRPVGAFDRTIQLLDTGLFAKHQISAIGVAGHPEGSPDIAQHELAVAIQKKNAFAKSSLSQVHITTQFCFDAAPIIEWEHQIRQTGNELPIHVGLAGLASLPTLIRHAKNCGVGASLGVLTRQAGRLLKLTATTTPARIVVELAKSKLRDSASRVQSCHFFPFGSFAATAAWAIALADGDFHLDDAELLFTAETANIRRE